jgi:hypothetical protein
LARLDPRGAQYFEASSSAALRSFFAALIVLPAFAISVLLTAAGPAEGESLPIERTQLEPFLVLLVHAIEYSLGWTVFPVICYRICEVIGRQEEFFAYLTADNWGSVIIYHLQLALLIVVLSGALPAALGGFAQLAMYAYMLVYSWYIARSVLKIGAAGAAGLAALQLFIAIIIHILTTSILYQPAVQPSLG